MIADDLALSALDARYQVAGSYVPTTRHVDTSSPLAGGGALSADLTLSIPKATGSVDGYLASGDWATFAGKQSALTFPLASTLGGTGVNNVGTLTNASNTTITGGGTLALAGYTLTVPATGTAGLLSRAQTWTTTQTIQSASDVQELIVKAFAGQTANLQEWQGSIGTILGYISELGIPTWSGGSDISNVFVGYRAGGTGVASVTGTSNVGLGYSALLVLTSGVGNVAIGSGSGMALKDGGSNMAIGSYALTAVVSSSYNVGVGVGSYQKTTGESNVGIGYQAGNGSTGGNNNVSIGFQSGYANHGNNNTFIGYWSGITTLGAGNIYIGYLSGCYNADSDTLLIDNQNRTNAANEKTNSILYGVMAATPASQKLRLNAFIGINATPAVAGLTMAEENNFVFGTTTGTQIGTVGGASGQKLGFWGATPVVQPVLSTGKSRTVDNVITFLQTIGLARQI